MLVGLLADEDGADGDADWRRAAVLTTSPATIASPWSGRASSSTIASPVLTATRSWSPSSLGPVADGERRTHRPLGIVPVRDRRAEDAHHGVADELLHASRRGSRSSRDTLVVRDEEGADVLGVERLRSAT